MSDKLEEAEFLRVQVLELRLEVARRNRDDYVATLLAKYAPGEKGLRLGPEGAILPGTDVPA